MDDNYILSVIQEYVDECLKEPGLGMSRDWFKRVSYRRWAADEIIKDIRESGDMPPILVVENFIRKMKNFSCRNHKTSIIFSVAQEMAEGILDLLIAMK